jgi:hypothetical protein
MHGDGEEESLKPKARVLFAAQGLLKFHLIKGTHTTEVLHFACDAADDHWSEHTLATVAGIQLTPHQHAPPSSAEVRPTWTVGERETLLP